MKNSYIRSLVSGAVMGVALACVSVVGFGCGSESPTLDDSQGIEQTDDDGELGSLEEAIKIGDGGAGFSTASSQLRCAQPGTSGQSCWIVDGSTKTVNYCFSGFTADEQSLIANGIELVDGQVNWTFNPVAFPCGVSIQKGAVSGTTNANIENYVKFTPGGTVTNLTSPAGISHVNGAWKSFTASSVVVDVAKFNVFLANSNPFTQLTLVSRELAHSGQHIAALALSMGTQTTSNDAGSRRKVCGLLDSCNNGGLTTGEVCRANSTVVGNILQISTNVVCGF